MIDQRQRIGRWPVAAPCHMLVGRDSTSPLPSQMAVAGRSTNFGPVAPQNQLNRNATLEG
jgi:hypothetical protein